METILRMILAFLGFVAFTIFLGTFAFFDSPAGDTFSYGVNHMGSWIAAFIGTVVFLFVLYVVHLLIGVLVEDIFAEVFKARILGRVVGALPIPFYILYRWDAVWWSIIVAIGFFVSLLPLLAYIASQNSDDHDGKQNHKNG